MCLLIILSIPIIAMPKRTPVIIYDLAQNVANRHSEKHPELTKLVTALFFFFNDLLNHLKKEEQILFPNITQLVKKNSCAEGITYTTFGFIKESAIGMMKEHLAAGNELKLFRKLTNNYLLPADACNSYKYLFEKMKEFENDLFFHVHLENNILFPKAITLDEELKEQERKCGNPGDIILYLVFFDILKKYVKRFYIQWCNPGQEVYIYRNSLLLERYFITLNHQTEKEV